MEKKSIKVDVVSDVACPWCYIGKRRLEAAVKQWKGIPVEVNWHPFQLDPSMPASGLNRDTYLTNKFGDLEKTKAMTTRIAEVAKEEGLNFNFGEKWLAVNTLPLHKLLHVAGEEGFQDDLKERFLKAYFDENLHLNDTEVLVSIMNTFSWDKDKTVQVLNDDNIAYTVTQEIAYYQQRGVTGVPFFIINDKYGLSGAQPPNVLLEAFASVAPIEVMKEGDTCDPVTGEC